MDIKQSKDALKIINAKMPDKPSHIADSFNIPPKKSRSRKRSGLSLEKTLVKAIHEKFWPGKVDRHHQWIDQKVLPKSMVESRNTGKAADAKSKKEGKEPGEKLLLEKEVPKPALYTPITPPKSSDYFVMPHDEYSRYSWAYNQFMEMYPCTPPDAAFNTTAENSQERPLQESGEILHPPNDELISYREKIEYIQSFMMNALLGTQMNHVNLRLEGRFEAWKVSSKFYQQLSSIYYDSTLSQ